MQVSARSWSRNAPRARALGCFVGVLASFTMGLACGEGGGDDGDGSGGSGGQNPFQPVTDLPAVTTLNAVWSFAPDDVWVAADGGRMLHYDGSTWTIEELGATATMLDIWGFAPDDVWAVGGSSYARWDGSSWTVESFSDAAAGISSVVSTWASSPTDVWVGGDQSTAAHFDGTSWTRYIAAGTENEAIWGSGPDDVYVAGVFGIAHWDGSSWTELEDNELFGAGAIWGSGPDDVWIADGSEFAHFDGSSWTYSEFDGLGGADALWGFGPDDVWGVGQFGSVLRNRGNGWLKVQSQSIGAPYLRSFVDVHGSGPDDIWVVGAQYGDDGITPQLYHYEG